MFRHTFGDIMSINTGALTQVAPVFTCEVVQANTTSGVQICKDAGEHGVVQLNVECRFNIVCILLFTVIILIIMYGLIKLS